MNSNELTTQSSWKTFWDVYKPTYFNEPFFKELLPDFPREANLIEIGGFPGRYAAYFKSKLNYDVTVLDYYIDPSVVAKVESTFKLPKNTIKLIEADFTKLEVNPEYNVVCSFGFIEHFYNLSEIINKHIGLLKKEGILLITVPNLRGINGLFQLLFDYNSYKAHNLKAMKIKLLENIMNEQSVKCFKVGYIGNPNIWLTNKWSANKFFQFFIRIINRVIRNMPFRHNVIMAPSLYILAKR